MNATDYFSGGQLKLTEAIDTDSAANVAAAVAGGASVSAPGKEKMTPLVYALANRKKKAAGELLRQHADPNQRTANGENGVTIATLLAAKDLDYLKLVLSHDGDPNTRQGNDEPILVILIAQANNPGIKLIAASKGDLNIKDRTGTYAILSAAMIGHWDCVYTLLQAGARWDVQWGPGTTVASLAEKADLGTDSPLYPDKEKTIEFLKERGVKFPTKGAAAHNHSH